MHAAQSTRDLIQTCSTSTDAYERALAAHELRLLSQFDTAFRKSCFEGNSASDSKWDLLLKRFVELVHLNHLKWQEREVGKGKIAFGR